MNTLADTEEVVGEYRIWEYRRTRIWLRWEFHWCVFIGFHFCGKPNNGDLLIGLLPCVPVRIGWTRLEG